MSNINIRNGILLSEEDNYSLYVMNMLSSDGRFIEYYIVIPKKDMAIYEMALDLPEKDYTKMSKEQVIKEIKGKVNELYASKQNIIYVLPKEIKPYEKKDALTDNDDRLYMRLYKKIMPYISNAYWSVMDRQEKDINIDNSVSIITDSDDDKKFLDWLYINKGFAVNGTFRQLDIRKNRIKTDYSKDTIDEYSGHSLDNSNGNNITKSDTKVKRLTPIKNNSHGYSSILFISLILTIAVIIGTTVGYLLIK